MRTINLLLLLLTLFSIATSHESPHPNPGQCDDSGHGAPVEPIVSSTCGRTKFPDVCISAAQSYAHPAPYSTARCVSSALVHAAIELTTTIRDGAGKAAGGLAGAAAEAVSACRMDYDEALRRLVEAQTAFEKNDKAGASCGFKAAIEKLSSCQRGVMEFPGVGPFAQQDELLQKMTINCISALDLV